MWAVLRNHGLAGSTWPSQGRKFKKWDSKQCASQICQSKHQHWKKRTPNVSHFIIVPFGVFSSIYLFFCMYFEYEMSLLPLFTCAWITTYRPEASGWPPPSSLGHAGTCRWSCLAGGLVACRRPWQAVSEVAAHGWQASKPLRAGRAGHAPTPAPGR